MSTTRKWAMIAMLTFFGGCIYKVTYLREVFYSQVIEALRISHTQLGLLSSAVGIASMAGYFFGGFLADRFSSKKMVMTACFGSGLLTLWYMTFPPFPVLMFIHGASALCGTLIFWAAYIRIVRLLGGSEGQGKYYGFSEGIRSLFGIILPFGATALIEHLVNAESGVRGVLMYYALCYFLSGFLAMFLIVDIREEREASGRVDLRQYKKLFMTPGLWLVALLIFGTYAVFALQSYTTPYMTEICGLPETLVSSVAIFRQYGLGLIAMPIFGILADYVKSAVKTCIIGLLLLLLSAAGLLWCPGANRIFVIILVLAVGFLVSGVRGVYYAAQDEARIPKSLSGTAAGIISALGFSPDAFMFIQVGGWLDKYPAARAYKMIWVYMMITSAAAIAAAVGILIAANHARHR